MKSRRLFFISHRDMRKNRADAVHIMRICREFVRNGFEVTLITPRTIRFEYSKRKSEIWNIHKIEQVFSIVELPVLLFDNMPRIFMPYSRIMRYLNFFLYFIYLILFKKIGSNDLIYSSDHTSTLPVIHMRKLNFVSCRIFLDKGDNIDDKIRRYVAANIDGMIAINDFIKNEAIRIYGIGEDKIFKRSFPSMIEDFKEYNLRSKEDYRKELELSLNDKIVVYSGKIAPNLVEIDLLLQAAKILQSQNIMFYFIGIREIYKSYYENYLKENKFSNIVFIDFQPVDSFIKYIKMADILVSYYDGNDFYSAHLRVPAKSSMYLSSGIPSIFADVPSLREWFSDDMVYFVKPNKPDILANTIIKIFSDKEEALGKAKRSLEYAKANDYSKSYYEVSQFMLSRFEQESINI